MKNELVYLIRSYTQKTQEEFADWVEVHPATIAQVEAGHRNASRILKAKISHKFDVTDEDFINYRKRLEKMDEL